MKDKKFKVLTHCGMFINEALLEKGIYTTTIPTLHEIHTTIEMMVEHGKIMKDKMGNNFISERYFENLKQCVLVDYELNEI